ncbi:hypothetical protein B0O80DRAFT_147717 [Mortierella sp. GBAus27b]|nr:hypothetical protein B0O80DRAFT_147717 [Mortierella sp. GBAus27b]
MNGEMAWAEVHSTAKWWLLLLAGHANSSCGACIARPVLSFSHDLPSIARRSNVAQCDTRCTSASSPRPYRGNRHVHSNDHAVLDHVPLPGASSPTLSLDHPRSPSFFAGKHFAEMNAKGGE